MLTYNRRIHAVKFLRQKVLLFLHFDLKYYNKVGSRKGSQTSLSFEFLMTSLVKIESDIGQAVAAVGEAY